VKIWFISEFLSITRHKKILPQMDTAPHYFGAAPNKLMDRKTQEKSATEGHRRKSHRKIWEELFKVVSVWFCDVLWQKVFNM